MHAKIGIASRQTTNYEILEICAATTEQPLPRKMFTRRHKKPKHKVQGMPNGEAPGILSIATTILLSLHNFHFCLRVSLRKTFLNLNISLGCYNATSSLMPLIALRTLKFFVECSLQEAQKYLVKSSPSRPSKQRFQIGRSL